MCEYLELPGIGHLPMDEDPAGFVAAVEPFLARALHREDGAATGGRGMEQSLAG